MSRERVFWCTSLVLILCVLNPNLKASYDPIQESLDSGEQPDFLNQRMANYRDRQGALAGAKLQRKHQKKIPKVILAILAHSTKLIDKQYDGITSVFHAAHLLSKMIANKNNYHVLKSIAQESKDVLRGYKSRETRRNKFISESEKQQLATELESLNLPNRFKKDLVKNLNPLAACRYEFNLNVGLAVLLKLGTGLSSATCRTPSGRRFRLFGAGLSMGVGVGASVGLGLGGNSVNFYVPIHSSPFQVIEFEESMGAFLVGEHSLKTGPVPEDVKKPWTRNHVNVGVGFDSAKGKKIVYRKALSSRFYRYRRLLGLLK